MERRTSEDSLNPLSDTFYSIYSLALDNGYTHETTSMQRRSTRQRTLENNNVNVNGMVIYDDPGVKFPGGGEWPVTQWKLGHLLSSVFVRALLVVHNVLTVWRVAEDFDDPIFWFLISANLLLIVEGLIVIWKRGGVEYSWWCPCFLMYLSTTIPAIWLLQLNQYNALVSEDERVIVSVSKSNTTSIITTSTMAPSTASLLTLMTLSSTGSPTTSGLTQKLVTMLSVGVTTDSYNFTTLAEGNMSALANTTLSTMVNNVTAVNQPDGTINVETISSETWLIIVQESLVYLLVFSRWLLPRGEVSREFLADLLLEFLAIASDIMELLAVFDEDAVRSNLTVTLWIMAVWSASFIQFIPILVHKRRMRNFREPPAIPCIVNTCGDKFVEFVVTLMSIVLQDGPFLVLRMYIIIKLRIVTYSLVFFILKNIVTLLLLVYRMTVMCYRIQKCRNVKNDVEKDDQA